MLFTVSLALLVPFISAASLPVLHLDSLDSNHAIFQDPNTTTSLVTPLSVTGRLNNTSISTLALTTNSSSLTTNSSSLGVVNAQAYASPPRYPPGYPGQPYDYYVRYSHIRLHCTKFKPDPLQNAEYLDALFRELGRTYSDPINYYAHLWDEDDEYYWTEGDERIGLASLNLNLPLAVDRPDFNMTYGEFGHVLIGLNNLRHDYPMLKIDAEIYREGNSHEIGLMWLTTYEPEDPDEPDMTEELVREAE